MTDHANKAVDPFERDRFDNEAGLLGTMLAAAEPALVRSVEAIAGPQHFNDVFNARVFAVIAEAAAGGLAGFPLVQDRKSVV